MERQRYPIGLQSFKEIREGGYVYVDKTEYIYQLLRGSKYYFLSRPRRFGKSLFLSTLKCFFENKRELFEGLDITVHSEIEWTERPVIHIDFNGADYSKEESLVERIDAQLEKYEAIYTIGKSSLSISGRFDALIQEAHRKTGQQVAVLIDEYDKPILDTLHLEDRAGMHRDQLRGFYSVLKSNDDHLKLVLLTGITKFGHLNIFSGLNNLFDISMADEYSAICGITRQELHANFDPGVENLAARLKCSKEEAYDRLKQNYDGYHFSEECQDIYNPFSLLNCLQLETIRGFWFQTGTSSFLARYFQTHELRITDFDDIRCSAESIMGVDAVPTDPIPLLYQSGYLTIKGYDPEFNFFTLGFPNREVKQGFYDGLLSLYAGPKSPTVTRDLVLAVRNGDTDRFMDCLQGLFSSISYDMRLEDERNFQNVVLTIFRLMGLYTKEEDRTPKGRIDITVVTQDYIYIIELKRDSTPEAALRQIKEKGYADKYRNDPRQIIELGINFSTKEREITGWAVSN